MSTNKEKVRLAGKPEQEWWIPESVIIEDDCFVFEGCTKRYQPQERFAEFRAEHKENIELSPPYIPLVNALNEFLSINKKVLPGTFALPLSAWASDTNNWEERLSPLTKWIKTWGPLGIMLHECSRTTYVQDFQDGNAYYKGIKTDLWMPERGWARFELKSKIEEENADIEAETKIYSDIATIGSNIMTTVKDHMTRIMKSHRPDNYEIEQYFSYVPDKPYQEFPAPLTEFFFDSYREPVHLFINSAIYLRDAIMKAAVGEEDSQTKEAGLSELRHLSSPASFMPISEQISKKVTRQRLSVTFSAPSLLSAMAAWAYADSLSPQKVFLCGQCKKLHASSATKSFFCSESCRKLNSIQKKRAMVKAKNLYGIGKSIAEIAAKLGRGYEEVETWLLKSKNDKYD